MRFLRVKIICAQIVLLVIGCNAIKEAQLQAPADLRINGTTSFSFDYVKKLIIVNADFNDSKKDSRLIFDTGAFQSKVEYHLAKELGLPTVSARTNGTAQGVSRTIEITTIDSIDLQSAKFYNIAAGKLRYDPKSYSPCVAPDGIIGSNLIKLANWKVDYHNNEIQVAQSPFHFQDSEDLNQLKFKTSFLSGMPEISLKIGEHTIPEVIVDLGYNGGLVLPMEYADLFESAESEMLIDQSTSGIFGSNRDTLLIKNLEVSIGKERAFIPVEFSSLNKSLLGNDFLEHFTLGLDFDKEVISFLLTSPIEIDTPRNFIPGILNDSLWIVNRTNPSTPLDIGDTLLSVNNKKPYQVYDSHCDYFLNVSKLNNGKEEVNVELKNGLVLTLHK